MMNTTKQGMKDAKHAIAQTQNVLKVNSRSSNISHNNDKAISVKAMVVKPSWGSIFDSFFFRKMTTERNVTTTNPLPSHGTKNFLRTYSRKQSTVSSLPGMAVQ